MGHAPCCAQVDSDEGSHAEPVKVVKMHPLTREQAMPPEYVDANISDDGYRSPRQQHPTRDFDADSKASASPRHSVTSLNSCSPRYRRQFEVEILRVGPHWRTLGLLVTPDACPNYLVVDDVWEPSLISEWNSTNPEGHTVLPGDFITCVNGHRSQGAMLQLLGSAGAGAKLQLHIAPPAKSHAAVPAGPWGPPEPGTLLLRPEMP
eukprot:CAMPEP_0172715980 /NCGR_PEP_ID=MMETSP1074-20121228/67857_1 /TAXON_ID=2916 /ORGANISM="Ceratium fusus, Strain PA161109" /LENGTH=205 /DNA_ID=CAMNT_0013540613 /DNA_START=39 /DNA_END=652 /DNA_ORIENTATION=-